MTKITIYNIKCIWVSQTQKEKKTTPRKRRRETKQPREEVEQIGDNRKYRDERKRKKLFYRIIEKAVFFFNSMFSKFFY